VAFIRSPTENALDRSTQQVLEVAGTLVIPGALMGHQLIGQQKTVNDWARPVTLRAIAVMRLSPRLATLSIVTSPLNSPA
jgi:hypothetical protein